MEKKETYICSACGNEQTAKKECDKCHSKALILQTEYVYALSRRKKDELRQRVHNVFLSGVKF